MNYTKLIKCRTQVHEKIKHILDNNNAQYCMFFNMTELIDHQNVEENFMVKNWHVLSPDAQVWICMLAYVVEDIDIEPDAVNAFVIIKT